MMRKNNSKETNSTRFKTYLMLFFCSLLSIRLCWGVEETQEAFLDAQTIYDGWEANYGNIKSMKFRLTQTQEITGDDSSQNHPKQLNWEKIEVGKRVYARTTGSEKGFEDVNSVFAMSFDGKVLKRYTPKRNLGTVQLGLKGAIEEFINPMKACLYGGILYPSGTSSNLRKDDSREKLRQKLSEKYPEGTPCFALSIVMGRHSGTLRVLPTLESVAGQVCHVVEISSPDGRALTKYWVAHEKGMLLLRYINEYGPDDYGKMEVVEIASVESDLGRVWYPNRAKWERKRRNGRISNREMRVHEFIPHIKAPPEAFDLEFPIGTTVYDHVAKISYVVGGDNSILRPKMISEPTTQPGDADGGANDRDDPELQLQENVKKVDSNDVNDASVSLNVLGDSENSGNLKPILLIGAVILVALGLIFFIRSKTSTGKETK